MREAFRRVALEAAEVFEACHPDPDAFDVLLRLCNEVRSIMDHSERVDPPLFDLAHRLLDDLGTTVRRHYRSACTLAYRDGSYFRECPVDLAHLRAGLSPEMRIAAAECSICQSDYLLDGCDHTPGQEYDGQTCFTRITDAEILAVALVGYPRNPDARMTSIGVTIEALADKFGNAFAPGRPVNCDKCASVCPGLNRSLQAGSH